MEARTHVPLQPLRGWKGGLVALVGVGLAAMVRVGLDSAGVSEAPYAPFIIAVLVAAIWGGRLNSIVAAVFGAMVSSSLVGNRIQAPNPTHVRATLIYLILCAVLIAIVDMMQGALRREAALNAHLSVVSRELHHRVKNVVTLAVSVAQQTGRNAGSAEEFEGKIVDRLLALGRAQDLLIRSEGADVSLAALVDEVLSPFDISGHLAAPVTGPHADVPHDVAVSLALLLNELATNATKYGALSVPDGRLTLGWRVEPALTVIRWTEAGGPSVIAPSRLGFGSRLFRSALARERGNVEVAFEPAGLSCEIQLLTKPNVVRGG